MWHFKAKRNYDVADTICSIEEEPPMVMLTMQDSDDLSVSHWTSELVTFMARAMKAEGMKIPVIKFAREVHARQTGQSLGLKAAKEFCEFLERTF